MADSAAVERTTGAKIYGSPWWPLAWIPGALFAPSETFLAVRERSARYAGPLLVLVIIATASAFGLGMLYEEPAIRQTVAMVGASVTFLALPILCLVNAFFLWWVISPRGVNQISLYQAFTVVLLAQAPILVRTLVQLTVSFSRGYSQPGDLVGSGLVSNLGRLFPSASGALASVLQSVDLFSLWSFLLMGMGIHLVGRVSRWRSLFSVLLLLLLYLTARSAAALIA